MRILLWILIAGVFGVFLLWMGQKLFFPTQGVRGEVIETTQICDPEEETEMPETFY